MNENYNSDLGRKTYKKKIPHRRNLLRNHQKKSRKFPEIQKKNHKKSTNRTNTTNNSTQHKK